MAADIGVSLKSVLPFEICNTIFQVFFLHPGFVPERCRSSHITSFVSHMNTQLCSQIHTDLLFNKHSDKNCQTSPHGKHFTLAFRFLYSFTRKTYILTIDSGNWTEHTCQCWVTAFHTPTFPVWLVATNWLPMKKRASTGTPRLNTPIKKRKKRINKVHIK